LDRHHKNNVALNKFYSNISIRAEQGLGIGTGIGQFFAEPEKIGKCGFLLLVFPTEDFLWRII